MSLFAGSEGPNCVWFTSSIIDEFSDASSGDWLEKLLDFLLRINGLDSVFALKVVFCWIIRSASFSFEDVDSLK